MVDTTYSAVCAPSLLEQKKKEGATIADNQTEKQSLDRSCSIQFNGYFAKQHMDAYIIAGY